MINIIGMVGDAIKLVRQLYELSAVAEDPKAKLAVAELQMELAELKTKIADLINENTQLKKDLEWATSTSVEMVLKDDVYYKPSGDGPFCTTCYDSKRQLIRLTEMSKLFREVGRWNCNACKAKYGGEW